MESENFKERLIEFARKQYDMGQTNFEAFTGIAPGSINKIRSGISTSSLANIADRAPADAQPLGYHPRIIAAPPERHHEQVPRVHDLLALGLRHYVAFRNSRDLAHVTQDAGEYL